MKVNEWLDEMEATLSEYRNEKNAIAIKKYFRNQFESFGLKNGERRQITKLFLQAAKKFSAEESKDAIRKLWIKPEREFQHTGQELLDQNKKLIGKDLREMLEFVITNKSWWDSVDYIASHTVGWAYKNGFLTKKDIEEWNKSDDMWLNRVSIIFQLTYKKETDWDLLQKNILNLAGHKDFFIRKAIGWALRQYSYTHPDKVAEFINSKTLSPLSVREGLKIIDKK